MKKENPRIHPKAVCAFCEHSFLEDDSYASMWNFRCKLLKYRRTIHPITGMPARYIVSKNGEWQTFDNVVDNTHVSCVEINIRGDCELFKKDINKEMSTIRYTDEVEIEIEKGEKSNVK